MTNDIFGLLFLPFDKSSGRHIVCHAALCLIPTGTRNVTRAVFSQSRVVPPSVCHVDLICISVSTFLQYDCTRSDQRPALQSAMASLPLNSFSLAGATKKRGTEKMKNEKANGCNAIRHDGRVCLRSLHVVRPNTSSTIRVYIPQIARAQIN